MKGTLDSNNAFAELLINEKVTVNGNQIELFNVAEKALEEDKDLVKAILVRVFKGDLTVVQDARLFAKGIANEMIINDLVVSLNSNEKPLLGGRGLTQLSDKTH